MPRGSFLLWRGYIPIRCDHGGEIGDLTAALEGLPEGSREVLMPATVEPLAPREGYVSSLGEMTLEKLGDYLEKIKLRKDEALQQLLDRAN